MKTKMNKGHKDDDSCDYKYDDCNADHNDGDDNDNIMIVITMMMERVTRMMTVKMVIVMERC